MKDLREVAIKGTLWSFTDKFIVYFFEFIIGIILARLLSPNDFGVFAILVVCVQFSQVFVDSGLSQAIIRKQNIDDSDYSTVFIANTIFSLLLFALLFYFADYIESLFNINNLSLYLRILAFILILDSFTIIQRSILIKILDLKKLALLNIISVIIGGTTGVLLAILDFGIYALIFKIIIQSCIFSLLLWVTSKWKFKLNFNYKSFVELYKFSYKLLLSAIIDKLYINFYNIIIAKVFSADILGYFNRAEQFSMLPSSLISNSLQKVIYPIFSTIQDDNKKLKQAIIEIQKLTMFIFIPIMLLLSLMSKEIILVLLGEKWLISAEYLSILPFVFILMPMHVVNLNLLNAKGFSNYFLKIEILKKIITIPLIVISISYSFLFFLYILIFNSTLSFFINSYYSKKLIDYSSIQQLYDIFPYFIIGVVSYVCSYLIANMFEFSIYINIFVLFFLFTFCFVILSFVFRMNEFKAIIKIKKTIFRNFK